MTEKKVPNYYFASVARYSKVQAIARGMKRGEKSSIDRAADLMAGMIAAIGRGRPCVLVPIPGHEGKATYTKQLCDEIGVRTGMRTANILKGNHHIALYHAKKNDMKPEGIRIDFLMKSPLPAGVTPIIVDNVLDTGHTAYAALRAVDNASAVLAVLGNTIHYTLNDEVTFTQLNVENMVNKKNAEVKQVQAAQGKQEAAAEKKTATTEKKENGASRKKERTMADSYMELKERHPDSILVFRDGDNYKILNSDASKVGPAIGQDPVRLKDSKDGFQQISFPKEALDTNLPKMIRAGFRIAIVDQQPAAKRTASKEQALADKGEKKDGKKDDVNTARSGGKENAQATAKTQHEPRAPQLVSVNGQKVTHAHAFQSDRYPDTWYFTARLDGQQLRPMKMKKEDVEAYQAHKSDVGYLMSTYYPTKMAKKVTPEEYQAAMTLSDGRRIDKMNVFKEKDESREDFGKYKLYVKIGEQSMATVMTQKDLNSFFDRVTTPRQLVENNFGERLNLATAYEKYHLPEGAKVSDIRLAKDQDGEWKISAKVGEEGRTEKRVVNKNDRYSFFEKKTVSREQLAAKYLDTDIRTLMSQKQEQKAGLKI
jgi:hypoxanthine phosphoribosyltransferase